MSKLVYDLFRFTIWRQYAFFRTLTRRQLVRLSDPRTTGNDGRGRPDE